MAPKQKSGETLFGSTNYFMGGHTNLDAGGLAKNERPQVTSVVSRTEAV